MPDLYLDTVGQPSVIAASGKSLVLGAGGVASVKIDSSGNLRNITRQIFSLTPVDVDAQNNTLTVAQIASGIVVHTSVTGAGTVTTDTATNIIAGSSGSGALANDGDCIFCFYVNDGTQTLTFAGGTGVTIADTGQTIAADESAILVIRRASATTAFVYTFGA